MSLAREENAMLIPKLARIISPWSEAIIFARMAETNHKRSENNDKIICGPLP